MSASNRTTFVCDKHPWLGFQTQRALDHHLMHAPSHVKQNIPQSSVSRQAGPVSGAVPVTGAISVNGDERWSSISASKESELLGLLSEQCHSVKDLLKERHLLNTHTPEELLGFQQCRTCRSKFFLSPDCLKFANCGRF